MIHDVTTPDVVFSKMGRAASDGEAGEGAEKGANEEKREGKGSAEGGEGGIGAKGGRGGKGLVRTIAPPVLLRSNDVFIPYSDKELEGGYEDTKVLLYTTHFFDGKSRVAPKSIKKGVVGGGDEEQMRRGDERGIEGLRENVMFLCPAFEYGYSTEFLDQTVLSKMEGKLLANKTHLQNYFQNKEVLTFHNNWPGQHMNTGFWFQTDRPYVMPEELIKQSEPYGWFHRLTVALRIQQTGVKLCDDGFFDRGMNKVNCFRNLRILGVIPVVMPDVWVIHTHEKYQYKAQRLTSLMAHYYSFSFCIAAMKRFGGNLPFILPLCRDDLGERERREKEHQEILREVEKEGGGMKNGTMAKIPFRLVRQNGHRYFSHNFGEDYVNALRAIKRQHIKQVRPSARDPFFLNWLSKQQSVRLEEKQEGEKNSEKEKEKEKEQVQEQEQEQEIPQPRRKRRVRAHTIVTPHPKASKPAPTVEESKKEKKPVNSRASPQRKQAIHRRTSAVSRAGPIKPKVVHAQDLKLKQVLGLGQEIVGEWESYFSLDMEEFAKEITQKGWVLQFKNDLCPPTAEQCTSKVTVFLGEFYSPPTWSLTSLSNETPLDFYKRSITNFLIFFVNEVLKVVPHTYGIGRSISQTTGVYLKVWLEVPIMTLPIVQDKVEETVAEALEQYGILLSARELVSSQELVT